MTPNYYLVKKNQPYDFNSLWDHLGFGTDFQKTIPLTTDVWEEKDHYMFKIDMPGVKEEDLNIEFADGVIHISGERKSNSEDNRQYSLQEAAYGKFKRSFRLRENVGEENITAALNDGVLSIVIPKIPEKKAKVITVNKAN